jgi:hypothetical protein
MGRNPVDKKKIDKFVNEMRNPDEMQVLIDQAIYAAQVYWGVELGCSRHFVPSGHGYDIWVAKNE